MNARDERQYLDDEQARHLYHNDQTFRQLVDCMVMLIRQLQLTPGEVRSAATFAAILAESRYPKRVYLPYDVFEETMGPEWFKAMQQAGHDLRIPTPPPSPQKSPSPIGEGLPETKEAVLLEFEFPSGSCWAGPGRLVERGGQRYLEREGHEPGSWSEHPSENAVEAALLVYDALAKEWGFQ